MKNTLIIYQICLILGIISTLFICPYVKKILKQYKVRQAIRSEGPSEHKVKEGTLTMGGISVVLPVFILTLFFSKFSIPSIVLTLVVTGYFLIGFFDDFRIISKGKNDGVSPKSKLFFQILVSLLFGIYLYFNQHTSVNIPFTSLSLNLGVFYIPFLVIVMVGTTNAVNLTDGLDGLASGCMAISILPLVLMLHFSENITAINYPAIIMGLTCIGSCLGFLWFNSHPASIFMGNTGSYALGGILSVIAISGNNELWLLFVGIIFVIETLSVIIQVSYYKRTKKRIFLMSPIHHHFEKKGWKETKITYRFYLISIIFALVSISGFLATI